MKESRILSMDFQSEWETPQGRLMKIYHIQLEDATTGTSYLANPVSFKEGDKVNYEMSKGKIKLYAVANNSAPQQSSGGGQSQGQHHQTYYLGYAYGYAKDIAIAEMQSSGGKKVSEARLKKLAETIYEHIGQMFTKDSE